MTTYQQRIAALAPCDLLISDIRREPRSDTQAGLIAELLRSLKAVAHHKHTEAALGNAAEEFDAIAADLKVIVDESEAEEDEAMRTDPAYREQMIGGY